MRPDRAGSAAGLGLSGAGAGLIEGSRTYFCMEKTRVASYAGGDVEVSRSRFLPAENSAPAARGHIVNLHLGGPARLTQRLAGGRAREGVLARGDAVVIPAGRSIEQAIGAASEDVNVLLGESLVRRVAGEAGAEPAGVEILDGFKLRDPQLERLMLSFVPELESEGLGGELYAEGLANALAVHLLREHSSLGERATRRLAREPKDGLSARQLRVVTDFIGDTLSGDLSLPEIAAQANLSPYHFARLFKQSTGLSPHQYVVRERVERSKGLLRGTDLSVGEVALAVGFANQSHFARRFRQLTGVAPSAFR
jgi:AraC family transcriptional regulator